MARRPKKTIMSDAEISKLRDIETYTHDDKKRVNNPPVGMAQHDKAEEKVKTYQYDPHIDPSLQWAGKAEGMSFDVPTSSIHIHESIKPHEIIRNVQTINGVGEDSDGDWQMSIFSMLGMETPLERMKRRQAAIQFYQHGVDWTNRLIAGDSLVIMNSLLEKEGMAGQVQMVYIDPPYGIKYGSNFQPFVDKRDVKDKRDEDLTQEPEMIKAFRDTWELGIHSYLTYLRDRLLLARELLSESGSVFVQISDDNVHLIRNICDELFGPENFVSMITFRKKLMPLGSKTLEQMADFLVWYSKDKKKLKYHQLFRRVTPDPNGRWTGVEDNGILRRFSDEEKKNYRMTLESKKVFGTVSQWAPSFSDANVYEFVFNGKKYSPTAGQCWITSLDKMNLLAEKGRLFVEGDYPRYGNIQPDSVIRKYRITASDGKPYTGIPPRRSLWNAPTRRNRTWD